MHLRVNNYLLVILELLITLLAYLHSRNELFPSLGDKNSIYIFFDRDLFVYFGAKIISWMEAKWKKVLLILKIEKGYVLFV